MFHGEAHSRGAKIAQKRNYDMHRLIVGVMYGKLRIV
jgi:hypothetical protein